MSIWFIESMRSPEGVPPIDTIIYDQPPQTDPDILRKASKFYRPLKYPQVVVHKGAEDIEQSIQDVPDLLKYYRPLSPIQVVIVRYHPEPDLEIF